MAKYVYAGPHPVTDDETGLLVHPGDVWEFPADPDWGPWNCLREPQGDPPPPPPPPPAATTPPATTPAKGTEGGI